MYSVRNGNRFQLAAIIYFILGNLAFGIVISLMGGDIGIIPSVLVSQLVFVGGAVLVYVLLKGTKPADLFIKPLNWVDALIAVGIAWTIMPLLSTINVLSQFFVTNQIQDALVDMMALPYLVTLLMTAVSPAVLEELLSRAIILRNYQKQTVWVTCIVSGIFFGFIHLNINQFLYAFVMGALMAYLVMVTDSVLTSMIVHFTINATGTTTLYISVWFMNLFDNSGELMEDFLSTTTPTNGELLISLAGIFFIALFFTPVAGILVNLLLKRHGKSFKGSLRMVTSEFMRRPVEAPEHSFSEELAQQEEDGTYVPEDRPFEKVMTPPLIATGLLFIIFAVLVEFAM